MATVTTIRLAKQTKRALRRLKARGETYDELVRALIDKAGIHDLDARWNGILERQSFVAVDEV